MTGVEIVLVVVVVGIVMAVARRSSRTRPGCVLAKNPSHTINQGTHDELVGAASYSSIATDGFFKTLNAMPSKKHDICSFWSILSFLQLNCFGEHLIFSSKIRKGLF